MRNVTLNVQGMSCNHCVMSIMGAMNNIGVTAVVNLADGTVTVQYDEANHKLERIIATIEEQGYVVEK